MRQESVWLTLIITNALLILINRDNPLSYISAAIIGAVAAMWYIKQDMGKRKRDG